MAAHPIVEQATVLAALLDDPSDDPAQLIATVTAIGRLARLVEGAGVAVAGRVSGLWDHESDKPIVRAIGERSPEMVLQAHAGLGAAEALAWSRVGAALRPEVALTGEVLPARHEVVSVALAEGALSVVRAQRVLEVVAEIEPHSSFTERQQVERALVSKSSDLTERQFAQLCRAAAEKFEPQSLAEREARQLAQCGVDVRRRRDGLTQVVVTTLPEHEGFIMTALDARTSPRRVMFTGLDTPPADADRRPLRERRLDALVSIFRESLGHDTGRVAGSSVLLNVTMTLDALTSGLGTAKIAGIDQPISASAARRLAADAEIIPVVLGSDSVSLDMGRTVRLATESQRSALGLRDGGCIWPTCTMPPAWCEVAHIVPWAEGGATDLDNMMLMCPFHHRCFDNDDWRLERVGGERYLIPPAWVDSARSPRRVITSHELAA